MKYVLPSLLAALLLSAPAARPQTATGIPAINSQAPFLAAAMSEFFSDTRAFTAGLELTIAGQGGGEAVKLPFGVAMADGKMRWELNMMNVKSAELPPEALSSIKDMGLDRLFFIYQPGKPLTLGFTGLKAYVELPVPKVEGVQQQAQDKIGRLEKKELGRETIAGQPTDDTELALALARTLLGSREYDPDFVTRHFTLKRTDVDLTPKTGKGLQRARA